MSKKPAKSKLLMPNLPNELPLASINELREEDSVALSLIQDCTLGTQTAANVAISQVLFKNVVFNSVHWPALKLTDTVFDQCDLSNVDFTHCFMDRVQLTNCKLGKGLGTVVVS
ncbi:pentapeptide repeat-containing protein [Propionispora vibrioides]|uniref:Pentapeptide repeat-containing protein n=1 Tax=Propionispora vibrioides TaxID=112903 RepID=A0A1H8XLE2_9FIRM|nr:pentapeptide repeat-containing protein [Propionispora vibrioides]SEP40924.1 Pentapeptide repeat-containing protein [Propionispora vibrioides]